ncbi:MAG TPA: tetratricopeptide repeat protein [Bryobacteraceae bacterium]|nr:tetratricopeptide repeat protein [Bryobacteraceae bacterium]
MQTNERLTGPGVSGSTVSVEQLAHPLSKKARKMIEKAQKYSHSGDHAKAIGELRKALEEPSAIPYAHSILGAELLKTGNVKAALQELKEGVLLLPHSVANHSNLGYALFLSGQKEEGEKEIREALKMDSTSPQARFLIGVIQLEKGSHDQEAEKDFQMAQGEVQSAHLGLAMLYGRQGNKSAADQQLLQYLGPERAARLPFARAWLAAALQQGPAATFGFPR